MKMIKYANTLDAPFKQAPWRKHKNDINIFWGEKKFFKKKQIKHEVQKIVR